ncbi:RAP domain-containing protein [Plasmodiophora brassicae]
MRRLWPRLGGSGRVVCVGRTPPPPCRFAQRRRYESVVASDESAPASAPGGRYPQYNEDTDVAAVLRRYDMNADQLAYIVLHSLSRQTSRPNHREELDAVVARLQCCDLSAISLRTASTLLSCIAKYDPWHRPAFTEVLHALSSALPGIIERGPVDARYLANSAHSIAKLAFSGIDVDGLLDVISQVARQTIGEFDPHSLSSLAWAFATVGIEDVPLFNAIAEAAVHRLEEFTPQSISNMVWAFATARVKADGLFDALGNAALNKLPEFEPQAVSNTLWAFASAGVRSQPLFDAAARVAARQINKYKPQNISITMWTFAKSKITSPALFAAVSKAAIRRLDDFQPNELSNLVWAFTKVGEIGDRTLFDAVVTSPSVTASLAKFPPQALSNTVWALASAGVSSDAFFSAVAEAALPQMTAFGQQELSNLVWAFAKAGVSSPSLFDAVARSVSVQSDTFGAQALSTIAWAFAKVGVVPETMFQAIAGSAVARIDEFNARDISNITWAFAKGDFLSEPLFDAVAVRCRSCLHEFTPQGVSNVVWAYATSGIAHRDLFDLFAEAVAHRVGEFDPRALSNTAWAYAAAGVPPDGVFDAIAIAAAEKIKGFAPLEVANLVWAFATAEVLAPSLFERAAAFVSARVPEFDSRELAMILWSFSMFNIVPDRLFGRVTRQLVTHASDFAPGDRCMILYSMAAVKHPQKEIVENAAQVLAGLDELSDETSLSQIHVWRLSLSDSEKAIGLSSYPDAGPLFAKCLDAFRCQRARKSNLISSVKSAMKKVGLLPLFMADTRCQASAYRLHFAYDGKAWGKMAIEVMGPGRFIGRSSLMNSRSRLRRRILRAYGWNIIEINYFDWDRLATDEERVAFVQSKIDKILSFITSVPEGYQPSILTPEDHMQFRRRTSYVLPRKNSKLPRNEAIHED